MAVLGLDKRLISKATRRWMGIGVAAGGVGLVLGLFLMSIIGDVIDGALAGENRLQHWLPYLGAILLLKTGLAALLRVATYRASQNTKVSVRDSVYRHTLRLGTGVLTRKRTGDVVNMTVDGMEWLEQYYGVYFVQFVIGMSTPIVLCLYIGIIDWVLGLSLIVSIPLTPMFLGMMGKQFRKVSERYFELQSHLSSQFLDSLQGMPTLKMFNQGRRRGEVMYRDNEQLRVETMRLLLVNQISIFLTDWGFALGSTGVMMVVAYWRFDAGVLTIGQMVALLLISAEFARPLNLIGQFFFAGAIGREVAKKIGAYLDEAPHVEDQPMRAAPESYSPTLTFNDVHFTYEGAESPALDGVRFTIDAGETVALMGPSGAGKSTVTHLLMRGFDIDSGTITIDGMPIHELAADWVREQFALVPQDPYLFYGTFADNLRIAKPDASAAELEQACKAANLHAQIMATPQGYDTTIGERGMSISGGQAQRLAIARALLKDAPFVILDEPTSQIDPETEAVIQQALARLTKSKTVLLVAHRLSTVERADRIVMLDNGRVVEAGAPAALADGGGPYARMLDIHNAMLAPAANSAQRKALADGVQA